MEFLRLLVSTEPADEDIPITRTLTLTNEELREVVAWKENLTKHPLVELNKFLEDSAQEDDALESLVESVQNLISILRDPVTTPKPDTGVYFLTLVLLNKLRCHAHFKFSANQNT